MRCSPPLLIGPLLRHIQKQEYFSELEASQVVKDVASALNHLHSIGKFTGAVKEL